MDVNKYIEREKRRVNLALEKYLPIEETKPQPLYYAIRYSIMSGGKRLRPILAISSYRWCSGEGTKILPVACALEMIHTFSLIHDDLPAIDNDDLRRGRETYHIHMAKIMGDKKLGEAIAIMAGDALHALAFDLLAKSGDIRLIEELAKSTIDLVSGEMADILAERKNISVEELEFIHINKTGTLITTSLRVGAILGNCNKKELSALTEFGKRVGLAFQIWDDILDVEGTTEQIGKKANSDQQLDKATYPKLLGLKKSKNLAKSLIVEAKSFLPKNKDNRILCALADRIIERKS